MRILARLPLFAVFLLALAPAAANDPIERWIAAIAMPGANGKPAPIAIEGDVTENGIPGTTKTWIDRVSRRRITTLRSRTHEEVARDGRAWTKDWNGKALELQGRDRRDATSQAYIEALVFGGAVGDIARECSAGPLERGDASSGLVVRFTPPGGVPFDVVLDGTTGLPVKAVRKPYDDEITLAFSDWRGAGTTKVPFSIKEAQGDKSENTLTVRKISTGARAATRVTRPVDGHRDFRFAKGSSASVPFNFENDHLMVHGRVNGSKDLWFMIDTGADATIVNAPRLGEMGLASFGATSVTGGGGSTGFAYADVARLEIGGLTLLGQRVGVMDLHGLEKIYGMAMGGLLGYDFLSRVVMRVNYGTGTIDLLEPSGFTYSGQGARIPFVLETLEPHTVARITVPTVAPIDADMLVDSGAAGTVNLTSPFVKAHNLLELARTASADRPSTFAGSEKEFFAQTLVRGRLQGFALGPFELKDVATSLMVGTTGGYASESFSGTIGQGLLHRFDTIYDYSRNTLILEPNAHFRDLFLPAKSFGVTLLSDGADFTVFTVTGVAKGSPAEAAGLKKGDVLTAIDGKAAASLRLADVRKLLGEEGAKRRIDVRRGEEALTLDVTITLVSAERG